MCKKISKKKREKRETKKKTIFLWFCFIISPKQPISARRQRPLCQTHRLCYSLSLSLSLFISLSLPLSLAHGSPLLDVAVNRHRCRLVAWSGKQSKATPTAQRHHNVHRFRVESNIYNNTTTHYNVEADLRENKKNPFILFPLE